MGVLFAGLGSIFYSMLVKLIGYEFVTRTTVIGMNAWAKTTKTHNDDAVTEAAAKAWGVDKSVLE